MHQAGKSKQKEHDYATWQLGTQLSKGEKETWGLVFDPNTVYAFHPMTFKCEGL